jgi:hypothetical protein
VRVAVRREVDAAAHAALAHVEHGDGRAGRAAQPPRLEHVGRAPVAVGDRVHGVGARRHHGERLHGHRVDHRDRVRAGERHHAQLAHPRGGEAAVQARPQHRGRADRVGRHGVAAGVGAAEGLEVRVGDHERGVAHHGGRGRLLEQRVRVEHQAHAVDARHGRVQPVALDGGAGAIERFDRQHPARHRVQPVDERRAHQRVRRHQPQAARREVDDADAVAQGDDQRAAVGREVDAVGRAGERVREQPLGRVRAGGEGEHGGGARVGEVDAPVARHRHVVVEVRLAARRDVPPAHGAGARVHGDERRAPLVLGAGAGGGHAGAGVAGGDPQQPARRVGAHPDDAVDPLGAGGEQRPGAAVALHAHDGAPVRAADEERAVARVVRDALGDEPRVGEAEGDGRRLGGGLRGTRARAGGREQSRGDDQGGGAHARTVRPRAPPPQTHGPPLTEREPARRPRARNSSRANGVRMGVRGRQLTVGRPGGPWATPRA